MTLEESDRQRYNRTYYERHKERISIRSKEYYQRNREKIIEQVRDYYTNMSEDKKQTAREKQKKLNHKNAVSVRASRQKWESSHPTWKIYHNAKRRARDAGVAFDIHHTDIIIPEFCPVLGIKLEQGGSKGHTQGGMTCRPELDRVYPELGYVLGNINVISARANRIKSNGTAEEHRLIADYMDRHPKSIQ